MENVEDGFEDLELNHGKDQFLRTLLSELCGILEESVGLEEAEGFIARVGNRIGRKVNAEYKAAIGSDNLNLQQVGAALVDLKQRINGGFSIVSLDEDRIVLVNTDCPFGKFVEGRPSLCMMTSNVFGRIAAENLDYARVEMKETIATGAQGCHVVVHLTEGPEGRVYFR